MSDLSPEALRDIAAMNARTYLMSEVDRAAWFSENPVSMFESDAPVLVKRARNRAAEAARDAAECISLGRISDARSLLAEASRHLDDGERRASA